MRRDTACVPAQEIRSESQLGDRGMRRKSVRTEQGEGKNKKKGWGSTFFELFHFARRERLQLRLPAGRVLHHQLKRVGMSQQATSLSGEPTEMNTRGLPTCAGCEGGAVSLARSTCQPRHEPQS